MDAMLERMKRALGSDASSLQDALDDAKSLALGYCNLEVVPPLMEGTVVRMAADLWRGLGYGAENAPARVASVSRGDVSTSFVAEGGDTSYTDVLERHKDALNGFRKLRWT